MRAIASCLSWPGTPLRAVGAATHLFVSTHGVGGLVLFLRVTAPLCWPKQHAYRRANRCHLTGRRQAAGRRIDAEADDGVGVLISGIQERAGRVDGEVARRLAASMDVASRRHRAGRLIDGKD